MSNADRFAAPGGVGRNAAIVGLVVALHVAGLWALQSGLLRRAVEVVVPAELISEFIAPPVSKAAPPTPAAPSVAPPPAPRPKSAPPPALLAVADPAPAPSAPTGVARTQPTAPVAEATVAVAPPATAAAPAPPAPAAPPRIELPSSDAAYLNNPKPAYPALSKRMGEQGKVVLRVLIGADGLPQKVEINQSSGFDRLDRQAQEAVMRWRFVPGQRNGIPEAMWNLVPVNFVLE